MERSLLRRKNEQISSVREVAVHYNLLTLLSLIFLLTLLTLLTMLILFTQLWSKTAVRPTYTIWLLDFWALK